MAASLDDILTTQKNGVIAINQISQNLKTAATNSGPSAISATIAASTTALVIAGTGILHAVSIPVASGSASVFVYDSSTASGAASNNLIYSSKPAAASYQTVSLFYSKGLVVKTEAGMNAAVSYAPIT